ncbi:hypothetical protein M501DRAFT_236273 [Patellaria atrata CBS 101060]|uniref:Uncharacterized protein n=1 Tax=Patellaria atrata CBS 101060 TaxID=1346257 RepID=A0A9P4VQU5_9PEZI|nr:hypothetical protein M501DRAFT_236273 [Patellaria atrata CBS 101060]
MPNENRTDPAVALYRVVELNAHHLAPCFSVEEVSPLQLMFPSLSTHVTLNEQHKQPIDQDNPSSPLITHKRPFMPSQSGISSPSGYRPMFPGLTGQLSRNIKRRRALEDDGDADDEGEIPVLPYSNPDPSSVSSSSKPASPKRKRGRPRKKSQTPSAKEYRTTADTKFVVTGPQLSTDSSSQIDTLPKRSSGRSRKVLFNPLPEDSTAQREPYPLFLNSVASTPTQPQHLHQSAAVAIPVKTCLLMQIRHLHHPPWKQPQLHQN